MYIAMNLKMPDFSFQGGNLDGLSHPSGQTI